jgi:acyl-CoA thioesterase FadM
MPRIQLKPLKSYSFTIDIPVRITDINYGGHLGNDRLLALVHEARIAFLTEWNFSEMDCGGVALIMGDAAIQYQGEAFAGDGLRFEVTAAEPSRTGFRLFYRITRPEDGKSIALVETGMICFDYSTRKIQPLPLAVRELCMTEIK